MNQEKNKKPAEEEIEELDNDKLYEVSGGGRLGAPDFMSNHWKDIEPKENGLVDIP
jgi:hypothetical protein